MNHRAGSVGEALSAAVDALRAAGVEDPRLDAELLMSEAAGIDRARLVSRPETPLEGAAARSFATMVRRRLRREPVAYILGRRWFRRLELRSDRRALVPRPETELLVEVALELGDRWEAERSQLPNTDDAGGTRLSVLDIGTGSGAVALAIADERPGWRVVASDTSSDALALARENAKLLGLLDRLTFLEGSVPDSPVDLIVANLPYVPAGDWPALPPEIRDFEPRQALLAGSDGLDSIRAVAADIATQMSGDLPSIALEIGNTQAEATTAILVDAGWGQAETRRDLAGHDRVVIGHP